MFNNIESIQDADAFLASVGFTTSKVKHIQNLPAEDVYDISIENGGVIDKAFEANGIIVHNSSDPEYIGNMMTAQGLKMDANHVFGLKDDSTGEWLIKPTVRYYSHDVGDDLFKYMGKIKRGLPDVEKHGSDYYYVFEHTKENKSRFAGMYDQKYLTKYNKIRVPARDGFMQAVAIVDSYPAMLPGGLDDDDRNEAMAEQARMFSTGIRKVKGGMRKKRITVIGVNQLREKPAVMYGPSEYEPGGQALKFYCFRHDTYLTTGDGLITAAEYAALGSGEIQSYKDPEQPTVFKQMGYSQILELETELGLTLAGKPGHRVLAIHTGGFSPKWTKLSDVNSGSMECYVPVKVGSDLWSETYFTFDYEHRSRFGNEQVEVVLPTEMSEELSFVLGVLAGDGHATGENGLVSIITEDYDLAEYYSECFNEVFGTDMLPKSEKERPHLYTCGIYSTQIAGFLSYLGATGYSRTKKVPLSVRMSPRTCVVSWLQGYTATDGNVGKKGVSFNSVSKQLLVDVQQILLNLGVISRLSEYEQNYEHTQAHLKRAWKLACLGSSARDLFEVLGDFGCERKNLVFASSNVSKESTNRLTGIDIIPFDLTPHKEGRNRGKIYKRIEDLLIYPCDKERTEGSQRKRKMYRLDAVTPEWIQETYDWIATLRTSHERQKSVVVFDKFVSFIRGIQNNNLMWVRVTGVNRNVEHAMTYDANMPKTSTIVTNGIVSHNSDVRIKSTSRSSPPYSGFKLDKGIMEEPSVTIKGGKDIYRFVCLKTTKNKLGGIPNREVWARIWVSDGDGVARGFDPVFDTYEYLRQLNLVSGTMANLKFHPDTPLAEAKKCGWQEFKALVLGSKAEITAVCEKIGVKPGSIRTWIKKHCASGKGPQRYKDQIVKTTKEVVGSGDDE